MSLRISSSIAMAIIFIGFQIRTARELQLRCMTASQWSAKAPVAATAATAAPAAARAAAATTAAANTVARPFTNALQYVVRRH